MVRADILDHEEEIAVSEVPFITCVDDDQEICEAMVGFLRVLGYAAEAFSSAEEFMHSDRLRNTSCLITDVQLHGMSGLQLQSRLAESGHRIPIIVITAFPDERVRDKALKAGAICFLNKPVTREVLIQCIRKALDRGDGEGTKR